MRIWEEWPEKPNRDWMTSSELIGIQKTKGITKLRPRKFLLLHRSDCLSEASVKNNRYTKLVRFFPLSIN